MLHELINPQYIEEIINFLGEKDAIIGKEYISDGYAIIVKNDKMPQWLRNCRTIDFDLCERAKIPFEMGTPVKDFDFLKNSDTTYLKPSESRDLIFNLKYIELIAYWTSFQCLSFYLVQENTCLKIFDGDNFLGLVMACKYL